MLVSSSREYRDPRGVALLHDNTPGLSAASQAALRNVDPASGFGEGLIGYCPCTRNLDGTPNFSALGHTGGYTWMQYVPSDNYAVVINVTDSIYTPDGRLDSVQALLLEL